MKYALLFCILLINCSNLSEQSENINSKAATSASDKSLHEKIYPYFLKGYYGFKKIFSGEILTPPRYRYVHEFKDGYAWVKVESKWTFINTAGKEMIQPLYSDVQDFSEGFAAVRKNFKWGFIDTAGKLVVDFAYDNTSEFSEGYASVKKDDLWGFVNDKGKLVTEIKYSDAFYFKEGLGLMYYDEIPGFVDASGNEIFYPMYSKLSSYQNGHSIAHIENSWGHQASVLIDKSGREILARKYFITHYSDSIYVISDCKKEYLWSPYKIEIDNTVYDDIGDTSNGYAITRRDDLYGIINSRGKEVLKPILDIDYANEFSDGRALFKKDEMIGYLDTKGEVTISAAFDEATDFEDGIAVVEKNEKRGLIDRTGKEILPIEYDNVARLDYGDFIAKKEEKAFSVVRINNALKITDIGRNAIDFDIFSSAFYIPGFYGIVTVEKNGKYGTCDEFGNVAVPAVYDELLESDYENTYVVRQNGKAGIVNGAGKIIVDPIYDYIRTYTSQPSSDIYVVELNNKYGWFNENGDKIIDLVYDNVDVVSKNSVIVEKNGKEGLLAVDGKEIIPVVHDNLYEPVEGFIIAQDKSRENMHVKAPGESMFDSFDQHGKYAYFRTDGTQLTDFICDERRLPKNGYVLITEKDKTGLLGKNGILLPMEYDKIYRIGGYLFLLKKSDKLKFFDVRYPEKERAFEYDNTGYLKNGRCFFYKGGKCGYIDENADEVIPAAYDVCNNYSFDVAVVGVENKFGLLDYSGKQVTPCIYDRIDNFTFGMSLTVLNGNVGLVSHLGNVIAKPIYVEIFRPDDYGMMRLRSGVKWGLMDSEGNWITPAETYDHIRQFKDGLAAVRQNNKYGYCDLTGKIAIEIQFDQAEDFFSGYANVMKNGEKFRINTNGEKASEDD